MIAPPAERRALRLAFGLASARGRRASNQDYAAFRLDPSHGPRGAAAVVADGLGGHKGGREAAETSVRAFIDGYYGASRHIPPLQAASRALEAVNGWVAAQGRRDPALENMATTFTALLLTGGCAHVLHVGDSRAYRLSGGRLEQLTEDHVVDIGEPALRLRRAIGFEPQILIDHAAIDLAPHDRLLLCTDGLHNALPLARLTKILGEADAPPETARRLIEAALDAGSADNVTALVVEVLDVPQGALENFTPRAAAPPRDRDALLFWRMLSGVLALCLMLDLLLRR
ncbi:PP2C family serine/threonine-protein phosphatase [Rhodoblastus sp.]|uniref:PP2C family protein-serine/threonine phosphatase n=1 Tax=Rhodoblastus sp. TaxID=1962975 RepID=UPI0035AF05FC